MRTRDLAVIWLSIAFAGCQAPGNFKSSSDTRADLNIPGQAVSTDVGRAHLASGNFALAERSFREAVEKDHADTAAWIGLAAAYDHLGRFELADRAYAQAARTGGNSLELINNRGYSYLLRGDEIRAMEQFELALQLDPTNAVIINNIQLLQQRHRGARATP